MIQMPRRAAALTGVSLLTIAGFGCGSVATEPSATPVMVFLTAAWRRQILVVDLEALLRNETGFQAAEQTVDVGAWPWDVVLDPDGSRAFVANRVGDNLHVVAMPSGTVVDSIPVGTSPVSLHWSGTDEFLYVTNVTSSTISVVDVASPGTPSVRETIALSSVGWLTGTSDGTLLVATMPSDDDVALIDTRDHSVLQIIPVGDAPQMVALGPDDRTAYVANFSSETITVIDLTTASVAAEISLEEDAQGAIGVAVSSDGGYLYVTRWAAENALGPGTLEKIDITTRETVGKIEVGVQPFDVEISPDGRVAVVSSFQGVVTVVDLVTDRVVVTKVGATLVAGLAFSPGR